MKRQVWIHPVVFAFVKAKIAPRKKGRPQDFPDVVQAIAQLLRVKNIPTIKPAFFKNNPDQHLKPHINAYIGSQRERRFKTLAANVNRLLQSDQ